VVLKADRLKRVGNGCCVVYKAVHLIRNDCWLLVAVRYLIKKIYGLVSFETLAAVQMAKKFTDFG
jgi:hypothetical protein